MASPPLRNIVQELLHQIVTITQYISGRSATTWHQLVADDFHLEVGGCRYRAARISFFVLCATRWNPVIMGEDCRWRRCNLGRIRAAASFLSSRYIGTKIAVHYQLVKEDCGFYISRRQRIRGGTRWSDVRGWGARVRAPVPRSTLPFHVPPSSNFVQVGSSLRQVLPVSPLGTFWYMSALSLRSGNTLVGNGPQEWTLRQARRGLALEAGLR